MGERRQGEIHRREVRHRPSGGGYPQPAGRLRRRIGHDRRPQRLRRRGGPAAAGQAGLHRGYDHTGPAAQSVGGVDPDIGGRKGPDPGAAGAAACGAGGGRQPRPAAAGGLHQGVGAAGHLAEERQSVLRRRGPAAGASGRQCPAGVGAQRGSGQRGQGAGPLLRRQRGGADLLHRHGQTRHAPHRGGCSQDPPAACPHGLQRPDGIAEGAGAQLRIAAGGRDGLPHLREQLRRGQGGGEPHLCHRHGDGRQRRCHPQGSGGLRRPDGGAEAAGGRQAGAADGDCRRPVPAAAGPERGERRGNTLRRRDNVRRREACGPDAAHRPDPVGAGAAL